MTSLINVPPNKARLLLVSDSAERLRQMRATLEYGEVELRCVCSLEELQGECATPHTLAAVDVNPAQLPAVLQMIRASLGHGEIPLLVETSRITQQPPVAGLLPHYRAMPCSLREMATLAQPKHESHNLPRHSIL